MNRFRTWLEIDKQAIGENILAIRNKLAPNVRFLAMVKGNAWGMDTISYAKCLSQFGVDMIGTTIVEDALDIRKELPDMPIMVLAEIPFASIRDALAANLRLTVCTKEYAREVSRKAAAAGMRAKVHVKINTGLNRIGIAPGDAGNFTEEIFPMSGLYAEGIFTHFSCADQVGCPKTKEQLAVFSELIRNMRKRGFSFDIVHCANTPATLLYPETHLDLVRVGMGIAGLYPSPQFRELISLKFPMRWKTYITYRRFLPSGERVGYGGRYVCKTDTTIATIPVGDADGLSKRFEHHGHVLIKGQKYKIAAISMDQAMVDLAGHPQDVGLNDEVVIIGRQDGSYRDPHCIAEEIGADVEELLCQISARVPRIYL